MSKPFKTHTIDSIKAEFVIEEGDCWIWQGHKAQRHTVPLIYWRRSKAEDGRMVSARGLLHFLRTGQEIITGAFYRASCGDGNCVNPEHIVVNTQRQHMSHMAKALNSQPAIAAIRAAKIGNSRRVLTHDQIQIIMSDPRPAPAVAADLGISESTVCRYRSGTLGRRLGPFGMMVATL
jgi:hypothetical protein